MGSRLPLKLPRRGAEFPFSLVDPGSLRLWYEPDSIVGSPVTSWDNKSPTSGFPPGTGDLDNGTATRAVAALDGFDVVDFNGTSDELFTTSILATGTPQPIVFSVVYFPRLNNALPNAGLMGGENIPEIQVDLRDIGRSPLFDNGGAQLSAGAGTARNGIWHLTTGVYNGTSSQARVDGTLRNEGDAGGNGVLPANVVIRVGALDPAAIFYDGQVAEIIGWAPTVGNIAADVASVESYLFARYPTLVQAGGEIETGGWRQQDIPGQVGGTTGWPDNFGSEGTTLGVTFGIFTSLVGDRYEFGPSGQRRLGTGTACINHITGTSGTIFGVVDDVSSDTNTVNPWDNRMIFGAEGRFELTVDSTGDMHWTFDTAGSPQTVTTAIPAGCWYFVCFWDALTDRSVLRVNGVEIGATTNDQIGTLSPAVTAGDNQGQFFGDALEFGSFARALSTSELATLETRLAAICPPAPAPTGTVNYSIGTAAGDIGNGGTVTVTSGFAVFSVAQPTNVGIGDAVLYGGTTSFISGRTDSQNYTLTDEVGDLPADVGSTALTSITREFANPVDAATDSSDVTHLNTTDLTTAGTSGVILQWPCYDDAALALTAEMAIFPWTTGASNYIRLYAPHLASEVGVSQRHTGTVGTGAEISVGTVPGTDINLDMIDTEDTEFFRMDGLVINGNNAQTQSIARLRHMLINGPLVGADIRIDGCIFADCLNDPTATGGSTANLRFIEVFAGAPKVQVTNCFFQNSEQMESGGSTQQHGIRINSAAGAATDVFVYNCTFMNFINNASGRDIRVLQNFSSGLLDCVNVYTGPFVGGGTNEGFSTGTTQNNNVSADATASGVGSVTGQSTVATYFVTPTAGSEDLHLLNDSNTLWGTTGEDLSGDANAPVTQDIDLLTRTVPFDIGGDEFS